MKRIEIPCEIAGRRLRYPVYLGRPTPGHDPLRYQIAWLTEELGAKILPSEPTSQP